MRWPRRPAMMSTASRARRSSSALGVAPLVLISVVGCNELLDIGDPRLAQPHESFTDGGLLVEAPQSCVLSSDCSRDLTFVCVFGVCSPECAANRDCDDGFRCFATEEDGAGCVALERTACTRDADCPAGSECGDGDCRNPCQRDVDCLGGQTCSPAGLCVGTDPVHERSRGAAAPDAASIDDAASDGTDAESAVSGDEPELASSNSDDSAGSKCEVDGYHCDDRANVGRHRCLDGQREALPPCPSGQLCDGSSEMADCVDVAPPCVGRQPGEGFCVGRLRTVCGPDLLDVQSTECASAQLCNAGSGAECAVCLDNTFSCDGAVLLACAADHMGFAPEPVDVCDNADECNAQAGACTTDACLAGQRRCEGDTLLECSDDLKSFDEFVDECGDGLCDSASASCLLCVADQQWCSADGATSNACSADGAVVETTPCPDMAPRCVGDGQCVECGNNDDCARRECHTVTCNTASGTCVYLPLAVGSGCTGGVCDVAGACVECATDDDCVASNGCHGTSCQSGRCAQLPHAAGATCDFDGGSVCDGDGSCVQCMSSVHCAASNACHAPTCGSDHVCDETPVVAGTACSFDGGSRCDGAGACVGCTGDGECAVENACFSASCSGGDCAQTPLTAGSPCDFDDGRVCDGGGACVECTLAEHCTPPGDCWTATCSAGMQCGATPRSAGQSCSGGGQMCDGHGTCVQCLGHDDCNAPAEYCSGQGACQPNSEFSVGYTQTSGGVSFEPGAGGHMFATRIIVQQDVDVITMALRGTEVGGSARMFLYADDGGQPGAFIAGTPVFGVQNGESGATPQPAATSLTAGTYWLAATFTGDPKLQSYSVSDAQSWRIVHGWTDLAPDPFDKNGPPSSLAALAVNFYLWVRIDTD